MYLSGRINTVQKRHGEIEDGHVGMKVSGQPDRLVAIRCLSDNLKPFPLQDGLQALADDQVVVGKEDAKGHLDLHRVRDEQLRPVAGG